MKNILTSSLFIATFALTACGGGSGGSSDSSKNNKNETNINVAAAANGATITPASASALIDGDDSTSWTATNDQPVVIDFGSVKSIKEFELKRVAAAASLGSNPDIKIELSTDNSNYTISDASSFFGGVPCFKSTASSSSMLCEMIPAEKIRYVRITIAEDKSYDLTEFTATSK